MTDPLLESLFSRIASRSKPRVQEPPARVEKPVKEGRRPMLCEHGIRLHPHGNLAYCYKCRSAYECKKYHERKRAKIAVR